MTYEELEDYLQNRMRMSHIYQPVMLKALLEGWGEASVEDIAFALLSYDQSQIEYYTIRTKNMVGRVLTSNGVVEPVRKGNSINGYRLTVASLTEQQRASLSALCDRRLSEFIESRGAAIWGRRDAGREYVPGSIRYQVLKRAKLRCELCGAHEDQMALHVDHIVPKARGGSDELSNFQALCMRCNTNKRDSDDTDFRSFLESYHDRDESCIFCTLDAGRIIDENELCIAVRDAFPVTELHTLIIPKRHVSDYFGLYQPELNAIHNLLVKHKALIQQQDSSVTGFNVGVNAGEDAGQTVLHVHVHLIPRRTGDVEVPRGGVRGVIPSKQQY